MRHIVKFTLALLFAVTVGYVGYAEDASAGHGRHAAGCGAAAYAGCAGEAEAEVGCAGSHEARYRARPVRGFCRWLWGAERREARRERRAARHAAYGCGGYAEASCAGVQASCAGGYVEAPPEACPNCPAINPSTAVCPAGAACPAGSCGSATCTGDATCPCCGATCACQKTAAPAAPVIE